MKIFNVGRLTVAVVFLSTALQAQTQADLAEIDDISTEFLTSMTCEVVIQAMNAKRLSEESTPEDLRHSVIDSLAFVYLQGYYAGLTNSDESNSERYRHLMEQHCKLNSTERFTLGGIEDGLD